LRWVLIDLLLLHGLIHLMGFAKAFGYAELPQLTQPISREWGVLWLLARGLVVATAMMLAAGARPYWIVGGLALLLSQLLIMTVWRDAWARGQRGAPARGRARTAHRRPVELPCAVPARPLDASTARARFTLCGQTIGATLFFDT
jgi:hypothetical protein